MSFYFNVELPKELLDVDKFKQHLRDVMTKWGQQYVSDLVATRLSGSPLRRRTGNLARGFNSAIEEGAGYLEIKCWLTGPAADSKEGDHGYGWAQEYGANITPKHGQYLWIPIANNLTSAGNSRLTPTQAIAHGGFISYKKPDSPIFFGVAHVGSIRGKSTNGVVPLFVLKKNIRLDPKMGATSLFKNKFILLESALLG